MLEHKGKVYARVSDILKPFVNFGDIPEEVLHSKAALGTRVHDAIHQEINGEFPVMAGKEGGYFKSFEKWRKALNPLFLESEVRYYCDTKMITGCIDALIKLEGEEKAILIDFKTSAQESPITWPMQAHLYHYLIAGAHKPIAPRFLFIKLDRYGNLPKVFEYKLDSNLEKKCFQAIDDFWKHKNVAINHP